MSVTTQQRPDQEYWKNEPGHEGLTKGLILTYYPNAGKFQVFRRWDTDDGPRRTKQNVTLDAAEFAVSDDAFDTLARFTEQVKTIRTAIGLPVD